MPKNALTNTFLFGWFDWPLKRLSALFRGAPAAAPKRAKASVSSPTARADHATPDAPPIPPSPARESVDPVTPLVDEAPAFMRHSKKRDAVESPSRVAAPRQPDADADAKTGFTRALATQTRLVASPDPAVEALQTKIAGVETLLADLVARHADMQQTLHDFQLQQYSALGDCLAECLHLRHEYARRRAERSGLAEDAEKARQAAAERADYAKALDSTPSTQPELDDATRDELKRLYRSAAMRCHPDRVGEADKAQAHDRFQRAQCAYRDHDIAALRELLQEMDAQIPAATATAETPTALTTSLSAMRNAAADLILTIQTLQIDDDYRRAQRRDDWGDYFDAARVSFEAECRALRAAIGAMKFG